MVECLLVLRYKWLCCPLQVEEHNGHIFKATQYSIPTYCEYCSSLIWMMDRACVCKRKEPCVHIHTNTQHNTMIKHTHKQIQQNDTDTHTHAHNTMMKTQRQLNTATWINQYCLTLHSTNRMPSNSVVLCSPATCNAEQLMSQASYF